MTSRHPSAGFRAFGARRQANHRGNLAVELDLVASTLGRWGDDYAVDQAPDGLQRLAAIMIGLQRFLQPGDTAW